MRQILSKELPTLFWLYHMGIVLFWRQTWRLMEHTVEIIARMISMASLPLRYPLRKSTLRLLAAYVMMISLVKPSGEIIDELLRLPSSQAFSYPFAGATRESCEPPDGYDGDHNRICLGGGERVFTAACSALRNWRMFDLGWMEACNPDAPIQPGSAVSVLAHCFGFWWLNICRIVYVIDEPGRIRRFGFAYGTTELHVERGEERFAIEWHEADDSVWYEICAFSQPAYWMARLGYPLARRLQKKFARDSKNAMLRAVMGG